MTRKKKKNAHEIKNLEKNIVNVLCESKNKPLNYKQIAAKLKITNNHAKDRLIKKLLRLESENKIEEIAKGKYKAVAKTDYVVGTVAMTTRGSAYIVNDTLKEDIFVSAANLNKALHGDTVKVYRYRRRRSKKTEGEVIEIVKRAKTDFVGVLQCNKNFGFVIPDSIKMNHDIFVSKNKLHGAKHGDKVVVRITDWPEKAESPFGNIIDILGVPGEHEVEMHAILAEFGLPDKFSDEVQKEADTLAIDIAHKELKTRKDMRSVTTFTIDPHDAKDFDDALSLQQLENGNYEIGIHIADVTHYVKEGSLLDQEAYRRGTSVYLVDRVVPMLPEILSNSVCSLRPHEDKLTFSAVFEINKNAEIQKQWFGRTLIHSDRRFTYAEAQEHIETGKGSMAKELQTLNHMAGILREQRMEKGAISFDKVEVKFHLDENNNPVDVYFKEAKEANHLVEEFMLLANKKVAEFVGKEKNGKPSGNTFVYRVHDNPDPEKLTSLQHVAAQFGYKIDTKNYKNISSSLNTLLKEIHGKKESNLLETLTVRAMSKAKYTTQNIGHYGLAFDYYTHFTSPIRRYPDIMVHRLLQRYIDKKSSPNATGYEQKSKHASEREILATNAERNSIKYMQIKFIENQEETVFDGVISGVTEWGIYVELLQNKCEGMVRIRDIRDDYYIFDEKNYALAGEVTKNTYRLGDEVRVEVKNTDLERKHLDFYLLGKKE